MTIYYGSSDNDSISIGDNKHLPTIKFQPEVDDKLHDIFYLPFYKIRGLVVSRLAIDEYIFSFQSLFDDWNGNISISSSYYSMKLSTAYGEPNGPTSDIIFIIFSNVNGTVTFRIIIYFESVLAIPDFEGLFIIIGIVAVNFIYLNI
ncbi:MAG: hypothetical protein EAX96_16360 [Candidatus Lokiarchaeota archaeon]|nr:hypothetical protein [Candidatus Lokiarchaeota archaeon]